MNSAEWKLWDLKSTCVLFDNSKNWYRISDTQSKFTNDCEKVRSTREMQYERGTLCCQAFSLKQLWSEKWKGSKSVCDKALSRVVIFFSILPVTSDFSLAKNLQQRFYYFQNLWRSNVITRKVLSPIFICFKARTCNTIIWFEIINWKIEFFHFHE